MLKKNIIRLITFLSAIYLVSINLFAANSYEDYFPLQVGNEWNYAFRKRWIKDTLSIDKNYFIFASNTSINSRIDTVLYDTLRVDSLGRIWKFENPTEQLWYDFTVSSDSIYHVKIPSLHNEHIYNVYVERDVTINTGFHRFDSCITFTFDSPFIFDEEQQYAFAPGIGLVRTAAVAWGMLGDNLASATINSKYFGKEHLFFPDMDTLYIGFASPPPKIRTEIQDSLVDFDIINIKSDDWGNTFLSNREYRNYGLNSFGFLIKDSLNQNSYELWCENIFDNELKTLKIPLDTEFIFSNYPQINNSFDFKLYILKNDIRIDSLSQPVKLYQVGTSVENILKPLTFHLSQNYPNPFNPTTMISYQLPINRVVNLSVYNILGEKIATLVNERKSMGYHQVIWDATNYSSGVYFYKIEAGEFVDYRKCLLVK